MRQERILAGITRWKKMDPGRGVLAYCDGSSHCFRHLGDVAIAEREGGRGRVRHKCEGEGEAEGEGEGDKCELLSVCNPVCWTQMMVD